MGESSERPAGRREDRWVPRKEFDGLSGVHNKMRLHDRCSKIVRGWNHLKKSISNENESGKKMVII